jgi:MoaA/NifB/PqqE/SkfB family radical SAM enzyme
VWREQDSKELSTEEMIRGLDILRELGTIDIVFSGGNPLIRDDISEILEYASRFFVTTVYDNGSMALEKIDALRNVDFVAISLDTLNQKKSDHIKGVEGSWKRAFLTIEKLHKEGIRVGVSPTISQFNLNEIVDLTEYFSQKGIPTWYCLYSHDTAADSDQLFKIGKLDNEFEIADREEMVKLCDRLTEMKKKRSNILITNKTLNAIKQLYANGKRTWQCHALLNFFMIDHRGRVAGCHLRKPVASIFELPEVWNSDKFNALRRTYSKCDRCIYLCYIVYSLHGSIRGNFQIVQDHWKSLKMLMKKT